MYVRKHSLTFTNTASTHTQTSTGYANGRILAVQYIYSTGNTISSTANLTITTAESSQTILDSLTVTAGSWMKYPRPAVVNTTNAAITNESGWVPVADERFKVKISKSTSTGQTGTFSIWVG
jgi:hypothetical protein